MIKTLGILVSTMTASLPDTLSFYEGEGRFPLSRNEKLSSPPEKEPSEKRKLPSSYQVCYGSPTSPIQITEYFSLSCRQCVKAFRKDFQTIKDTYLKRGEVCFNFHLDPADALSFQALVCLEKLSSTEKIVFWESLLHNMPHPSQACAYMQKIMQGLGKPIPSLHQEKYLETTAAFREAQQYLQQKDIVREFPTVEINARVYDEMPTLSMLSKEIERLLKKEGPSQ